MKRAIFFLSFILCASRVFAQPITGATSICIGSVSTLSDTASGGIWVSGSTGIAAVDSFSGDVSGIAAGTSVITYYYPGGGMDTISVSVISLPAAITGAAGVCAGATTALADATTGGTWSSSNTAVTTIDMSSGVVSGISADTATIMFTSLATGCASWVTITVNPLPDPITGSANYCVGIPDSLYEFGSGAWSTGSPGIITLGATAGNITGLVAGIATVTYTLPTGCATEMMITVNPLPDAGTITGPDVICVGGNADVTDDVCCGMWSSDNVSIAVVGSGSGIITGLTPGLITISYNVTNICGTVSAYLGVDVLATADCGELSVKNTVAIQAGITIYPNPVNDGNFSVNVLSGNNEQADIVITNVAGEKVKSFTMPTNQKNNINLEQPAGVYIISATTAHGSYEGKITIQ